ncbi:MAG: hypothetical protein AAF902_11785 [Chloroflexota bacterium]
MPEKKNEISMAPQLIDKIDLKGQGVCADALLTQRKIAADILGNDGHCIWFLKENQPTVMVDMVQFFQPARKAPGWHAILLSYQTARSVDKGHGRLEIRQLRVTTDHN